MDGVWCGASHEIRFLLFVLSCGGLIKLWSILKIL